MGIISKEITVKAILMDSGCDFGRCPLASRLPTALWPVFDKPAIEHLLLRLSEYGVKQTIIYSNSNGGTLKNAVNTDSYCDMKLEFSESSFPIGTAGCIRDAIGTDGDSLLLVLPASIVNIPDIGTLIDAHHRGQCELTAVLNPADENDRPDGEATGIYICEPTVLEHIPAEGYYDIKESLIPAMLRAGKNIYATRLSSPAGNFRSYSEYLSAIFYCFKNIGGKAFDLPVFKRDNLRILWTGSDSRIDASAKIYGPVVIMEGARISEGAIIFGPTVIGRNAKIGRDSLIVNSVLWDNSQIGSDCQIEQCVVDNHSIVRSGSILQAKAVLTHHKEISSSRIDKVQSAGIGRRNLLRWMAAGFLLAVFAWSYWSAIKDLWNIWQRSDEYSSGLLVPFLAAFVLWSRRERLASCSIKPSLWGLPIFLAAQAMNFFGLFFMYGSIEGLSIVVSIAAIVLLLFGWQLFRQVFTILVFLFLMLPLPQSIHSSLMLPLQSWATSSAVFCLELFGYGVVREGNIINISGTTVAVAEACNGLRMVIAFFVVGGFIVLLSKRTWWEKMIIFVSCLPIALLCNTVRLAVTSVAFTVLNGEYWGKMFHDFGGYAMMPLAVGIVILEFWLLSKIITVQTEKEIESAGK